jgi:twinkle protein
MKYQSSNTKKVYELDPQKKRSVCPECSHNRRKQNDVCVNWDLTAHRGYCHHCQATFFLYESKPEKIYSVPEWKNKTKLSNVALKWFNGRGISQNTLNDLKVYSDQEYMPQHEKEIEVICFPYFKDEKLINIKYRGANKSFKLVQNAELCFWNIDAMAEDVIIVEGEIDLLSFYEAGFKSVISVPNGAGNIEYLDGVISIFDKLTQIYLAVDNDKKGVELRDELARRFGFEKCLIVDFKECKDANEYLTKYSAYDLAIAVGDAKSYPVKGIIKVNDIFADIKTLFETGTQPGLNIQMPDVDNVITWEAGRLVTVTGIPGHGKSEFVDYLVSRLNFIYGWRAAYFTPENYPLKYHYAKIYEKYVGKKFSRERCNEDEFNIAYEHIRDNYFYIMDEEDNSVEMVIESAKSLVKNRGIKILVIDPYNKLEHLQQRGESETQYISRFLDAITSFAKFNNVMVILVAHPKKMQKGQNGFYEIPNLYDISGSAHFYNKTDYGITIYRNYNDNGTGYQNTVAVHVQKVKFKHLGESGVIDLNYNYTNGRFESLNKSINDWDNNNWLIR